jgi:hypothetical protein
VRGTGREEEGEGEGRVGHHLRQLGAELVDELLIVLRVDRVLHK